MSGGSGVAACEIKQNSTHVANAIPASSPVAGENIYSNHGRGIFLINQLMDEVRFRNNGKEIHMLKR